MNIKKIEKTFEYKDIDWNNVSLYENMLNNEEFVEVFKDKINWNAISYGCKLNESFVEKYADKVVWFPLFDRNRFSINFLKKHYKRIKWNDLPFVNLSKEELQIIRNEMIKNDYFGY